MGNGLSLEGNGGRALQGLPDKPVIQKKKVSPLHSMPVSGKAGGPDLGCVRRDPLEGPEEKQRDMLSVRGEKPFVGRLEKGREEPLRLP